VQEPQDGADPADGAADTTTDTTTDTSADAGPGNSENAPGQNKG
jgi:hypothetical protein